MTRRYNNKNYKKWKQTLNDKKIINKDMKKIKALVSCGMTSSGLVHT